MLQRIVLIGLAAAILAACDAGSVNSSSTQSDDLPSLKGKYTLSGNCGGNDGVLSIGDETVQFSETVCQISDQVEDGDVSRLDLINCVSSVGKSPDQTLEFFLDGNDKLTIFGEDGDSQYTRCSG